MINDSLMRNGKDEGYAPESWVGGPSPGTVLLASVSFQSNTTNE